MASRQIIWKCSACDSRHKRESGESMGRECPTCETRDRLFVWHDSNIGNRRVRKGGKYHTEIKRYEVDGSRKTHREYQEY